MWPWLQIRFAWVRISGVSGRFQNTHSELMPFLGGLRFASFLGASGRSQINRLALGSWTVLGVHMAGVGADNILDSFALWEAVISRCKSVTMEWALQLIGLMFWVLRGSAVGHLSTSQLKELGFAIAWARAWDAVWASNNGIFNSFG
jgi:hypothetical protein